MEFHTTLSRKEVTARIQTYTDPWKGRILAPRNQRLHKLKSRNRLYLYCAGQNRNRMKSAQFYGKLEETAAGTAIIGKFSVLRSKVLPILVSVPVLLLAAYVAGLLKSGSFRLEFTRNYIIAYFAASLILLACAGRARKREEENTVRFIRTYLLK